MTRRTPNPLDRLHRPLIDPATAIIAVLFSLLAAPAVAIFSFVIASPFSWCA